MSIRFAKWKPDEVVKYIEMCRVIERGVPVFKVKFGNAYLTVNGKKAVLASCWGGYDFLQSVLFVGVPEEDVKVLESTTSDWLYLLEKYGKESATRFK